MQAVALLVRNPVPINLIEDVIVGPQMWNRLTRRLLIPLRVRVNGADYQLTIEITDAYQIVLRVNEMSWLPIGSIRDFVQEVNTVFLFIHTA